jgi:gliding motility-associated-like protein
MLKIKFRAGPMPVLLVLLCIALRAAAQPETAIWHFGANAGLDFRGGAPVGITDGQLNTLEGCATIADAQGNLLFYSDGVNVWNRLHQLMPNGTGLKGHLSATQSALIVPHPGNASLYLLFTADESGYYDLSNDGVHYSVVNMCLEGGLGDVTRKNVFLFKNATEKLAAVKHRNGTDYWVVSSQYAANRFLAYLVTEGGVSPTPVISPGGTSSYDPSSAGPAIGYLKLSPGGNRLAQVSYGDNEPGFAELFDFDPATGKVANPRKIMDQENEPYGIEFSPGGNRLYVSTALGKLYQFDVTGPDAATIRGTATLLVDHGRYAPVAGMQLGPDGKIYVASYREYSLGVIHHPERRGTASGYQDAGIVLERYSTYGLPNFVASYFDRSPRIRATDASVGTPVTFALRNAGNAREVRWSFGDGTPQTAPAAPDGEARHVYPRAGTYLVRALLGRATGIPDTVYKKIFVTQSVLHPLGPDTVLCRGNTLTLDVSHPGGRWQWQDGSAAVAYQVTGPGLYWVEICGPDGLVRDSIRVDFADPPRVRLPADTLLCEGDAWTIDVRQPHSTYRWQDGSTAATHRVTRAGVYWVEVANPCDTVRASVRVRGGISINLGLPADTTLPVGQTLALDVYQPHIDTYRWSTGATGSAIAVTEDGTYAVEAANPCSNAWARVRVTFYEDPAAIFVPNVFTPNGDGKNDVFETRGLYPGRWALVVHARNGRPVYQRDTYRNDWDGHALPAGVYFYQLRNKMTGHALKGWVHLLR